MASDFPAAFSTLRDILKKHGQGLIVLSDKPNDFTLITPAIGPNKKPIWFGAVLLKKSAVTYHLFPLYFNPKLQAAVPPALLKRKQGKTCFNFQRPDAGLFALLDALTGQGRACFKAHGLLEPGRISSHRLNSAAKAGGEDIEKLAVIRETRAKAAATKRTATIRAKRAETK